jgi:hypothetical protein
MFASKKTTWHIETTANLAAVMRLAGERSATFSYGGIPWDLGSPLDRAHWHHVFHCD